MQHAEVLMMTLVDLERDLHLVRVVLRDADPERREHRARVGSFDDADELLAVHVHLRSGTG